MEDNKHLIRWKITATLIILFSSFEFFRTVFSAVYSVYYIDRGLELGDVSSIKVFQMIGILIFEIPSGYLADKYGRIKILIISVLVMAASFLGLAASRDYITFAISEFVYGIALALSSGTIYTYINQYQEDEKVVIENSSLGHLTSIVNLVTFISGNIGAFLYKYNPYIPFLLGALGFLVYPLIVWILFKKFKLKDNRAKVLEGQTRTGFLDNRDIYKRGFRLLLIFNILFIATSQFIYQYWSVYFIKVIDLNANLAFSVMLVASIIGGYVFVYISRRLSFKHVITCSVLVISLPLILIKISPPLISLMLFSISQIGRGMMTSLSFKLINDVSFLFEKKSMTLSIMETITQIFNIFSLLLIGYLVNIFSLNTIFVVVGVIYIFLIPVAKRIINNSISTEGTQ